MPVCYISIIMFIFIHFVMCIVFCFVVLLSMVSFASRFGFVLYFGRQVVLVLVVVFFCTFCNGAAFVCGCQVLEPVGFAVEVSEFI